MYVRGLCLSYTLLLLLLLLLCGASFGVNKESKRNRWGIVSLSLFVLQSPFLRHKTSCVFARESPRWSDRQTDGRTLGRLFKWTDGQMSLELPSCDVDGAHSFIIKFNAYNIG